MTFTLAAPDTVADAAASLRDLCGGSVHLPGDAGYDAARVPWNVAFDQRPAAVAYPADTAEVAEVVRAAAAAGLRVAPQGTGHNAGALADLGGSVLLRTSAMTGTVVGDGTATVRAGELWLPAVEAASAAGVAVLHGSSPDVGVVGYSLGGGMGWYARRLGLQTNSVTAAELVLADGSVVRTDAQHEPDLFWALRGGGGSFGVVTELSFRTYAFDSAYAGILLWDWERSPEVLRRWRDWAAEAPDEVTTSCRILRLPPLPELPEFLRGRSIIVIDGAVLADDERAAAILAPLRDLQPEIDTFGRAPAGALVRLHMDPEGPTPAVSSTSVMESLPDTAIDALLGVVGPGSDSVLMMTEFRQLGGALGRPAEGAGALPAVPGAFIAFAGGIPIAPEVPVQEHADRAMAALAPWSQRNRYLNFLEHHTDASVGYAPEAWERLRAIRQAVDPDGVLQANHEVR